MPIKQPTCRAERYCVGRNRPRLERKAVVRGPSYRRISQSNHLLWEREGNALYQGLNQIIWAVEEPIKRGITRDIPRRAPSPGTGACRRMLTIRNGSSLSP